MMEIDKNAARAGRETRRHTVTTILAVSIGLAVVVMIGLLFVY